MKRIKKFLRVKNTKNYDLPRKYRHLDRLTDDVERELARFRFF